MRGFFHRASMTIFKYLFDCRYSSFHRSDYLVRARIDALRLFADEKSAVFVEHFSCAHRQLHILFAAAVNYVVCDAV